ncbi:hypothetical protein [Salmonella phage SSBI34]|nr:hypothetical protein [Salmonella phage SSBI34]
MAVDPNSKIEAWTPMIRTSDMKYPVYLRDYLDEYKNVSIGSFVWESGMREVGYFKVHDVDIPVGDVVTEGKPVYSEEDDLWHKTWIVRDFTEEEIAHNLVASKEEARTRAYQIFENDQSFGISLDGDMFSVEDKEINNLRGTLESALKAESGEKFLIRKVDFSVLELTPQETVEKVTKILSERGKLHQTMLAHVKSIMEAPDKESIPSTPHTFLGE